MPQLDKVTFLSQFFWLCFFYFGFYYVILKFYLPKISRILSLRQKKMGFSNQGMISLQQENQQVREDYQELLSKALSLSKTLFSNFFSQTTNWLSTNATTINKTQYQKVNTSFVQSLGETSLSQNVLFYHAEKNLPEKLTFKMLQDNLQTIKKQLGTQKSQNLSQESPNQKKIKK
jgi:hypothetical protein